MICSEWSPFLNCRLARVGIRFHQKRREHLRSDRASRLDSLSEFHDLLPHANSRLAKLILQHGFVTEKEPLRHNDQNVIPLTRCHPRSLRLQHVELS